MLHTSDISCAEGPQREGCGSHEAPTTGRCDGLTGVLEGYQEERDLTTGCNGWCWGSTQVQEGRTPVYTDCCAVCWGSQEG